MDKIPFDIKYRPQIESGEYKVKTRNGSPVRIVCWDRQDEVYPVVALVLNVESEDCEVYTSDGKYYCNDDAHDYDLIIITPEPELSEFEKELESFYNHHLQVCTYDNQGTVEDSLHDGASKLLALARKELQEKVIKDYWKQVADQCVQAREEGKAEALKEIEQDPESSYAFKRGVEYGKEEALKDLPRWKKWGNGVGGNGQGIPIAIVKRGLNGYELVGALGISGEQYIMLSDLEKLPKEE